MGKPVLLRQFRANFNEKRRFYRQDRDFPQESTACGNLPGLDLLWILVGHLPEPNEFQALAKS